MVLENELTAAAFLAALWFGEKAFLRLGVSPVISNIVIGVVMGPSLLDCVPYYKSFQLFGKLGVMLLVIESGLGVDLAELRKVGIRAFLMALTGVVFPVGLTLGVMKATFPSTGVEQALSIGSALAPTSLGFSAKLLKEFGLLETENGVLICTAAVVDDVMSLVLLGVILALDDPTAWNVTQPVLGACASGLIGAVLAVLLPRIKVLDRVPEAYRGGFGLTLVLALGLLVGWASAAMKSSDLLGCFVVGVAFSSSKPVTDIWETQVKKICLWGTRLFFGATIAFSVPSLKGEFFSSDSLLRFPGLFGAALIGKMTVGLFARPCTCKGFWMLGWAMGGRGEFSFLIASDAMKEGLITTPDFCATVLALLGVSLLAPAGLRCTLGGDKSEPAPQSPAQQVMSPMPATKEVQDLLNQSGRVMV